MNSSVLNVQELCDQVASFLQESKWDLRACSLVSPALTSAAQRHLFSDIIFNRGSLDIDDISLLERYDEVKVCGRFCAVLKTSPHLIPYVRRMRISLESGVLKLLTKFEFPNLHDVVFHRRRGGAASEEVIALAAQLIGAPSIRRVGLVSPIFDTLHDMSGLFDKHTPALDSIFLYNITFNKTIAEAGDPPSMKSPRVSVKTLRWGLHQQLDPAMMLDPAFPLNFSALVELDFGAQLTPVMQKLVERARCSIRRLSLDAQHVANDDYASSAQPTFLAQLPALTHLTLSSTAHHLADAEILPVPPTPAKQPPRP
ncbi:hypothetical protein MVEN_01095600 [Mycena venus]|uniref:Uncharacterized protein n=1 Tax=Mycena venus TaxID=2733690 RepID=A0A8H6Y906_9AGAR|nr:hypothetical protein MVEN_01095600 [Mycena venus]